MKYFEVDNSECSYQSKRLWATQLGNGSSVNSDNLDAADLRF